ncbi:TraI domain-containing protein [Oryzomonas rubra]|uniref:Uncharacterized protein n=1 Tax=Oryzomonas rubra TaxID=2509454 RepID=A0A5A9X529_9BACT|nr:TraI domain-containing protein [Oryzomonas rubra]KAA0888100.1 hypothetical protein ET418_17010 [Oryzomonas rubra]
MFGFSRNKQAPAPAQQSVPPVNGGLPNDVRSKVEICIGIRNPEVIPCVEKFMTVCGGHPASMRHHHAQRGGLFVHSMDVAFRMVALSKTGDCDEMTRIALFLTGMLHDIGKVGYYGVETNGYYYHPLLLNGWRQDWVSDGKTSDRNGEQHRWLSALLMYQFLPEFFLKSVEPSLLAEMVEAVVNHHTDRVADSKIALLLKNADGASAAEATGEANRNQVVDIKTGQKPALPVLPLPSEVQEQSAEDANREGRDEALRFLGLLKMQIFNGAFKWQENKQFFIFKELNAIGILNPVQWEKLREAYINELKYRVSDALIVGMLDRAGMVQMRGENGNEFAYWNIRKARKDGSFKDIRLNLIMLRLDEVFNTEQINRFQGAHLAPAGEQPVEQPALAPEAKLEEEGSIYDE